MLEREAKTIGAHPFPYDFPKNEAGRPILFVKTPAEIWYYGGAVATTVTLDTTGPPLRIRLRVRVLEGCVGVGLLTRDQSQFRHELTLPAADDPYEIDLLSGNLEDLGPLVVRNAFDGGPSTASCEPITADVYSPPPFHLVYTCGKVGSQTIERAIREAFGVPYVAFHHYLSDATLRDAMETCERARARNIGHSVHFGPGGTLEQVERAKRTRVRLEAKVDKSLCIITGVRDPLSCAISGFFQSIDYYLPNLVFGGEDAENQARYVAKYIHERFECTLKDCRVENQRDDTASRALRDRGSWFEDEFKRFTKIDLLNHATPDPFSEITENGFRVLLYRYEQLHKSLPDILAALGVEPRRTIVNLNIGTEKSWGALYAAMRRVFEPSAEMLSYYYDTDFARAFGYKYSGLR